MALRHVYNFNSLVVSPGKAMIDWVNTLYTDSIESYTEHLTEDGASVYLIPEFESPDDVSEWLKDNFHFIFLQELAGWTEDESSFPPITWENFNAFCRVSYQSMVHLISDEEE